MAEPVVYGSESGGVIVIIVASFLSIIAILFAFATGATKTLARKDTHLRPYFISLLAANFIQSLGTTFNAKWVAAGYVYGDTFCAVQGALKHAGNIATAMWAFTIAAHLFHLLFLRWKSTKLGLYLSLMFGWSLVLFIITLGPTVIATPRDGPYFGISGLWCWITPAYPREQFFLEYFFEFFAAGVGVFLYTAILLRVRGNLVRGADARWRLRWVPRGQSWQLAVTRDLIDSAMVRAAAYMVWYPIAYSFVLLPIALVRMTEFAMRVPPWATILCDIIFNLNGFINVILLITTRRLLPDTAALPTFATPRKVLDLAAPEAVGITPFVWTSPGSEKGEGEGEGEEKMVEVRQGLERRSLTLSRSDSSGSRSSLASADSQTGLVEAGGRGYSIRGMR